MKKTLKILGAGALTLSLFGCSSSLKSINESVNELSANSDKKVDTVSNSVSKQQLSPEELFRENVKQVLVNTHYDEGDVKIILDNNYSLGWVTSIGRGSKYTDEQAQKKLLLWTCELLHKNPKLDGVFLRMQRDDIGKYYAVKADKGDFNQWIGFNINDDKEWKNFNIDSIDSSAFIEKFVYIEDISAYSAFEK